MWQELFWTSSSYYFYLSNFTKRETLAIRRRRRGVAPVILRYVKCLTVIATCVLISGCLYLIYWCRYVSPSSALQRGESRSDGGKRRLALAGVCRAACASRCKVFVEKLPFLTRHICIEAGVSLHGMINYSLFKWVGRSPAATCTLSLFLPLFIFMCALCMGSIFIGPICVYVLLGKTDKSLCGNKMYICLVVYSNHIMSKAIFSELHFFLAFTFWFSNHHHHHQLKKLYYKENGHDFLSLCLHLFFFFLLESLFRYFLLQFPVVTWGLATDRSWAAPIGTSFRALGENVSDL